MEIVSDICLVDFGFWAGGLDSRHRFSSEEMSIIEDCLSDCMDKPMTETEVNDLFWFDAECLCEWLGLEFEEWVERPDDYYLLY